MSVNQTAWTAELQEYLVSAARCWNCCGGRGQPAGCVGQQRYELQALLDYLLGVLRNTRWDRRVLEIQIDCLQHSTSEDGGRRGGIDISSHFVSTEIQTCP